MDKTPLPSKEVLLLCMKVAGSSIEGAEYFARRFEEQLRKAKMLPECQDILDKVKEFADFVRHKLTSSTQPWKGEQNYLSDFQNMQENLATEAAKKLEGVVNGNVIVDVAFGPSGAMLRGYSDDNGPLSAKETAALDTLLNSWFAKQDHVSKGSRIFLADKDGDVKLNASGKDANADSDHLRVLIKDPDVGCETFMEDKGVAVTVRVHEYPVEQLEAGQEAVAKAAEARATAPSAKQEEAVEMEPEAPHTGMSSGG
ncbi:hypothetical protein [uncultured Legionella sp.]|uniref:hypothetical protein n=1 Tax=uncultured Legionella sp. TaxID=210934 RepID=UPI002613231E|nr:hypothetical protein [uncultured Legionella sp.]